MKIATEPISKEALKRLPNYLRLLKELQANQVETVSSTLIAGHFNWNPVQVRKDLAAVSTSAGKPKTGFIVADLIDDLNNYLGFNSINQAVLIGAGQLGRALMGYSSFSKFGLEIVAAFDTNVAIIGKTIASKPILPMTELEKWVKEWGVLIGIVTVPKENAQEVCNLLVQAGIRAIWNFAPTRLQVPKNITLKSEDLATSLIILSQKLSVIMKADENNNSNRTTTGGNDGYKLHR